MIVDQSQATFGGGIISPNAFSRRDLQKWSSGVQRMNNFFVESTGGASNRPGTAHVTKVKDPTKVSRMIPFKFNEEQAYALEFRDQGIRVFKDGALLLEDAKTITAATQANPVTLTVVGHGYSDGDEVFVSGVVGMTELNYRFFTVTNVAGDDFDLLGEDGSGHTAYVSGGEAGRVLVIETPYLDTELAKITHQQSNDVLYLASRNHHPRKLSRIGAGVWTLGEISFKPSIAFPQALDASANPVGTKTYKYKVTAIAEDTLEESLPGTSHWHGQEANIVSITNADPAVVTTGAAHLYSDGEEVNISDCVGMEELNDRRFIIANVDATTFELIGEDSTEYSAYVSGGLAPRTVVVIENGHANDPANTITFDAVEGAESYNVYKEDEGLFGLIGTTALLTFTDDNIKADIADAPPKWNEPFHGVGNKPGVVGLHEGRTAWGNSDNDPLTVWLSKTGQYENMQTSSPTKSTDAITAKIVTGQGGEIRHFRSFLDRLFAFGSSAVSSIRPTGDADAITPASKKIWTEFYLGSSSAPPIVVKDNILMVSGAANDGFEVHSLGYSLESDHYKGTDLTVLAQHLFVGHTIIEWAYAERPHKLLACVRDDGKVLVMTYLHEHKIFAWSEWDLGGKVKSICSVPEGHEDVFYFIVERTINGQTVQHIERMHSRLFDTIADAYFVDDGLTYDGTDPKAVTGATQDGPVVITTAADHGYSEGDKISLTEIGGMVELHDRAYYTAVNVSSQQFSLYEVDGTDFTAYTSGGEAQKVVTTITGLDHLEGEDVVALVDGHVEEGLVVSGGSVSLAVPRVKVHVGKAYFGDIESLPVNVVTKESNTRAVQKIVQSVTLRVVRSRGFSAGAKLEDAAEYNARSNEPWNSPASLKDGTYENTINGTWGVDVSVVLKSHACLPVTFTEMIHRINV